MEKETVKQTQGESIAAAIMPFITHGIEKTTEALNEVQSNIAKTIDSAIKRELIGMIRLDLKTKKAIDMHDDLIERLTKLVKYVDDNFNVRGDGIIQELKKYLKQAETNK